MLILSVDLWNTLYRHVGSAQSRTLRRNECVAAMCGGLSLEQSRKVSETFSTEIDRFILEEWQAYRCPSKQAVIDHASRQYGLETKRAEAFIDAMEGLYTADLKPQLTAGAKDFLAWASQSRPIYMVSDTYFLRGGSIRNILHMDGVGHMFKATLFSDELGTKKINPRAFRVILDREQRPASDLLHIGDDHDSDCVGAKNAGAHTVLLREKTGPGGAHPAADFVCASFPEVRELLSRGDWRRNRQGSQAGRTTPPAAARHHA